MFYFIFKKLSQFDSHYSSTTVHKNTTLKYKLFLCLCPKRWPKSHKKATAQDKRPTLMSGKNVLQSRNTMVLNTVLNNHTKQTNISHACMIEQALMFSLELIFYAILYQTFMLINTLCKDEYIRTTHKHILKDLWESNLFPEKPVLTGPSWTQNHGFNPWRSNRNNPHMEQGRKSKLCLQTFQNTATPCNSDKTYLYGFQVSTNT